MQSVGGMRASDHSHVPGRSGHGNDHLVWVVSVRAILGPSRPNGTTHLPTTNNHAGDAVRIRVSQRGSEAGSARSMEQDSTSSTILSLSWARLVDVRSTTKAALDCLPTAAARRRSVYPAPPALEIDIPTFIRPQSPRSNDQLKHKSFPEHIQKPTTRPVTRGLPGSGHTTHATVYPYPTPPTPLSVHPPQPLFNSH